MYYYANDIIQKLKGEGQLVIFGAGYMASLAVSCLCSGFYSLPVKYCLVSSTEGAPGEVMGVPVIGYGEAGRLIGKGTLILAAVVERNLASALQSLESHGYQNVLPLTYEGDLWSLLRGNCYREERLSQGKPYLAVEEELLQMALPETEEKTARIYTAKCHVDKGLREGASRFCNETPIQVGAALTGERICSIRDDTGENISEKNRQYCELTALYWIWKNDQSGYVGLGHYRRHFELTGEQLKKLAHSDIDAVLTIPILDLPSVGEVYRRDHVSGDWGVMLEAVKELSPCYMGAVKEMQEGRYYYAYNMFIMRREILEGYCEWLFPILSYCEGRCGEKQDTYQNRYIGFLAEHLMSAYFLYHEGEYKVAHARKHFIL